MVKSVYDIEQTIAVSPQQVSDPHVCSVGV